MSWTDFNSYIYGVLSASVGAIIILVRKVLTNEKKIELLEKEHEAWNLLIRNTIIKTVSWLVMVGTAGFLYGLHLLPENLRRALTDWASK